LCISGYPARDFLEFEDFIQQCENALLEIALHTQQVAALVGCPRKNPVKEGKDLYNAAFLLHEGKVKHITDKTLLPTYDVFDEYRYFEPNKKFELVDFKGTKLAITICEDIWNVGNDNPLYTVCPLDEVAALQPQIILNLSASPFSYVQHQERLKVVKANVLRYKIPMVYVNQVGAQTELIFDGGSVAMNATGRCVCINLRFLKKPFRL
jgi:NAD+ synthase (glutamine-hydrolysing)